MGMKNTGNAFARLRKIGTAGLCGVAALASGGCETAEDFDVWTRLLVGTYAYSEGDYETAANVWSSPSMDTVMDNSDSTTWHETQAPAWYCEYIGDDAYYLSNVSPVSELNLGEKERREEIFAEYVIEKYDLNDWEGAKDYAYCSGFDSTSLTSNARKMKIRATPDAIRVNIGSIYY